MTVSVVEREGGAFLFFGMALHNMLYAFVMNPGQEGMFLFLEYLQAEHKGVVLLVFDERRAAGAAQDLPQDKLAAALAVLRWKRFIRPSGTTACWLRSFPDVRRQNLRRRSFRRKSSGTWRFARMSA